ncbi:MAG: type II secretion system F family protein [Verrucomicrobiota bacterium]
MVDLSLVFRSLHSLTKAGVSLAPGCRKLAANANTRLTRVWNQLAEQLEAGQTLAEALRLSPLSIESWMLDMVQAGENSGTTELILKDLTREIETRRSWRRSLWIRLLYPGIVLHLTALLPAIPLALNHGGTVAMAWMGFFLLAIYLPLLVTYLLSQAARQSPGLKRQLESIQLRLPVLGSGLRAARSARFYRTLGALARASSRWEEAITSAASASNSAQLQYHAAANHAALAAGVELTPTLKQFDFFTNEDLDQLGTGEITGTLDETLERLADTCWETATQRLKLFSVILTVGVYGLCVCGILLAMASILGPIYLQVFELLSLVPA